jgi:hypothetical protein
MSEAVDIEIQINSDWRIVVVAGGLWGPRAWLLERLIDGAWCGQIAAIRSSAMLREFVKAKVGQVDADAAAQLAALPARIDIRSAEERAQKLKRVRTKKRSDVCESSTIAATRAGTAEKWTAPGAGAKQAAAAFMAWRAEHAAKC